MPILTYTVERTCRTTRTTTIQMDEGLYRTAANGNIAARNKICIMVKKRLGVSGYVPWGSLTFTLEQPPLLSGACDDCAMCDLGNHHQCRKCTL